MGKVDTVIGWVVKVAILALFVPVIGASAKMFLHPTVVGLYVRYCDWVSGMFAKI